MEKHTLENRIIFSDFHLVSPCRSTAPPTYSRIFAETAAADQTQHLRKPLDQTAAGSDEPIQHERRHFDPYSTLALDL